MLYLIGSIIFAAGAGASGAQQMFGNLAAYGILSFILLGAGFYSISKEY